MEDFDEDKADDGTADVEEAHDGRGVGFIGNTEGRKNRSVGVEERNSKVDNKNGPEKDHGGMPSKIVEGSKEGNAKPDEGNAKL